MHLLPDHTLPLSNTSLHQFLHELSESLGNAIDAKDTSTKTHSEEVAIVAHQLALSLGMSPTMADVVHIAGHLHDIGKIGIPDSILFKKGALTAEEWSIIRQHPSMGATILRPLHTFDTCGITDMVLQHHEKFDGTGYPFGLSGNHIVMGARIIAVADALSAMLQTRPYRAARSFADAMDELSACSGSHFDPQVIGALHSCRCEVQAVMETFVSDVQERHEKHRIKRHSSAHNCITSDQHTQA